MLLLLSIQLLLILLLVTTTIITTQFNIISQPPSVNINNKLINSVDIEFTPRVFAKYYNTPILYTSSKCSSTGNVCTGNLRIQAPYYSYKLSQRGILPSGVQVPVAVSYLSNILKLPTVNNDGNNPNANTGSSSSSSSSSSSPFTILNHNNNNRELAA